MQCLPVSCQPIFQRLTAEVSQHFVSLTQSERVVESYLLQLGRSSRLIDHRHPIVRPPIGEQSRVVEPEDIDVPTVDEVVRQYCRVSSAMIRADDTDKGWLVTMQNTDEGFGPATGYHPVKSKTRTPINYAIRRNAMHSNRKRC